MNVSPDVKVTLRGESGRVSEFTVGDLDAASLADRASIVVTEDGRLNVVLEVPVTKLNAVGMANVDFRASVGMDFIKQVIDDFLNSVDPGWIEQQVVNSGDWGGDPMGVLVIKALKEHANALHR